MNDPLLRAATADDGAELARIYAPVVALTAISFELEPPDATAMAERVRAAQPRWPWIVACDAHDPGALLGYASAGVFRARPAYRFACESAIYVDPNARRQGLGRRLYGALLGSLRRQGLHRVVAGISLPNPASVALHEGLGFTPAGVVERVGFKFDRWHDMGFWTLNLAPDLERPRDEPRSTGDVDADGGEAARREADGRRTLQTDGPWRPQAGPGHEPA